MVFTRVTEDLFAADGSAQNVVGPISWFSAVPKISFDGTSVVDEEGYTLSTGQFVICTFSTDGSTTRNCGGPGRFPAFTPSGQIVTSTLNNGYDRVCLYVIGTGCTRDLAVDASNDLDEAAVSPDGSTLAVVVVTPAGPDPAGGHIALYDMSTGQPLRQLTAGTTDETPAWSPDGSRIVFSRDGSS